MEGKSRRQIMASTQRLQAMELGGRAVRGGWIRQWHDQALATWEGGDDRWGPIVR
jgi:hypothetical protein